MKKRKIIPIILSISILCSIISIQSYAENSYSDKTIMENNSELEVYDPDKTYEIGDTVLMTDGPINEEDEIVLFASATYLYKCRKYWQNITGRQLNMYSTASATTRYSYCSQGQTFYTDEVWRMSDGTYRYKTTNTWDDVGYLYVSYDSSACTVTTQHTGSGQVTTEHPHYSICGCGYTTNWTNTPQSGCTTCYPPKLFYSGIGSNYPSYQSGYPITISSTIPLRVPYKFKGWSTSSSASSANYIAGNSYYGSANSSTYMYAVWEQANTMNSAKSANNSTYIYPKGVTGYFSFIAPETGTYAFESSGLSDTYGYIYDSSGKQLAYDNNSGSDSNFCVTYDMTEGETYYLGAKYSSTSATGTISTQIKRQYNIMYDASGGSDAPTIQSKLYGEDLTLSSAIPTYGEYVFLGWSSDKTSEEVVYHPGDTYTIDADITLYAVWDTDNLRYLTFDSNTGTITACSTDARNITIPEYIDGVKVVAIGDRAFENCTNLYSVKLPESITSIGQECFKGCESLQSITLPDSVTSIGTGIFTDCSSLGSATLSNNLTFIPNRTFKNCQSLNNVKINSSIESIGLEAFMDCQGLTNLTIPRSVNSIGNYAFSGCNSLRIINIPTGVTSIGVNTFKDCSALTKATIPAEVTSIASGAFSNCPKLVIYGYKNSTAQSYASDNNIQFSLIPDAVSSINETFEKNELPAGWISSNSSGAYWSVGSTQDGDYHAMFNSYSSPSGSKGRLVSPSIKVAGGQTVFVSCYMRHDLGYSTRKDRLHLEYSVDNGDTWTQLTDDKVRYNGNEEWEKISAEIPNLENGTVCIGFVGISDYGNYIYVDNITVSPVDNTAEVESVSFDVSDITMNIGDERTIKSSVLPENARDRSLTWASSDESVAVVTDGHIKAIKDGTAVITATSSNGKKAQCSVTVTKVKSLPEVETKDTSNITTNSANISGAITNDGNSSITSKQFIYYEKNSPDSKYTIEADSNFSASLTNLKPSTEYWYQAQAENEIGVANGEIKTFTTKDEEVIIEPDSIQITPTYLSLQPNDERTLAVTVLPANAQNRNVVWESEDTSVVTIDNNGNIKAVGEGKTKVKATTVVNRLSAYCEIEVKTKEVSGNFDFSEHNMITNSSNLNEKSGFDYGPDDGGNSTMATAYLSRWNGAVLEENDQYPSPARPENIKYNEVDSDYHVQNVIYLPDRKNALDNDDIKKAIMNYGAVHAAFLVNWDCFDNSETNYYLPEGMSNNGGHAIAIVGWDDNYSKDNFVNTPPGNGAFICKNSWGTYSGEDGYFYISYYDSQIGIRGINTVFNNIENKTNYNKIYQYDPLGAVGTYGFGNKIYGANVFPSEDSKLTNDEILKAVSFYTNDKGTEYEIYIVPNYQSVNSLKKLGTSVASGVMEYAGYHTVNLPEDITIKAGTRFAVVVKLSNKSGANMSVELPYDGYSSNARGNHGESFLSSNGTGWTDINDMSDVDNANVCIKAFTSTAQNRITLMSAIDNETREYESNSVYNIDEVINSGFEINPELVSYLNNNSKGDISLFSDNSNNSMGQIPDAIIIGNTDINFAEGIAFPERYDLRDSNSVSPVKNQGGIGSCWSFATYASLESCLLKKADNTDSGIINLDNIINNSTAKVAVDSINIVDNCKMAVGTEKVIQAEILPLSAAKGVKWSSSDENIVTIDTSGHIYAKSIGTAIITVECGGKSASCSVMVTNGTNVESISLNEKSRNADVGDKFILNYSIAPEDALNKKVVWRSSNPDIANVDEYGVVTILQNGKVTITATTADGEKTDVCVLNDGSSGDITPTPIPEPCFTIENNGTNADVTNTGEEQTVTVIIAQYDGGVLQNVKAEEITFAENEKRTFTLGEGTYKVFVWDSLSGMVPMTR